MHEASCHEANAFITLTYGDAFLPPDGSLRMEDFQLFMKRLRRSIAPSKVRFFHCGEYGAELWRPHYHALLFGHDFLDKVLYGDRGTGPVWRSAELERLWPVGLSEIGTVSFESAAYVARYVTKKVTGGASAEHYERVDVSTGEVFQLKPEYATMSRNPGLGAKWFERFSSDVYPADHVISRGREAKPPRFYDQLFARQDPEGFEEVQRERARERKFEDETPARLAVREVCAVSRLSFSRRLEEC